MTKVITVQQAAELSGLSPNEIRNGLKNGKYPGMRVGQGQKRGKFVINEEAFIERLGELCYMNTGIVEVSKADTFFSNSGKATKYGQLRVISEER